MKLAPDRNILLARYTSLTGSGQEKTAREEIEAWIAKYPGDVVVRFRFAGELAKAGALGAAIRQAELLAEQYPDNALLLNNLASLYLKTGDKRAFGHAERAYQAASSSPAVADTYGWALFKKGQERAAVEVLRQAHAGLPENPDVAYHLAAALDRTGKVAEAKGLLEKSLKSNDSFETIRDARDLLKKLNDR